MAGAPGRTSDAAPSLFAAHGDPRRRPGVSILPRMLRALDGRGWVGAGVLSRELNTSDRALRAAAAASRGQILGGQAGYILTRQASLREVARATAALLSQSNRMRERVAAIEKVRHGASAVDSGDGAR